MTREEEIERAATCYVKLSDAELNIPLPLKGIIKCAFRSGARWADEHPANVWHEASEKPRTKEWILIQFSGGDYEALALDELGIETWSDWWCDNYKVIRWAYISDLLPKQFGNK